MAEVTIPDMSIDLAQYQISVGDPDYVNKKNLSEAEIETWAEKLNQIGVIFSDYLTQAQNIPDALRVQLAQLVADAQASEQAMRNLLASVNWPELPDSPAGYMFRVNDAGTGYEAVDPSVIAGSLADGLTEAVQSAENTLNSAQQALSEAVQQIQADWAVSNMPTGSLVRVVENSQGEKSFEPVSFASLYAEMHKSAVVADPGEEQTATINLPNTPVDNMTVSLIFEFCPCDRTVIVNAGSTGAIYGGYASMTLDITSRSIRLMYKNDFWRAA